MGFTGQLSQVFSISCKGLLALNRTSQWIKGALQVYSWFYLDYILLIAFNFVKYGWFCLKFRKKTKSLFHLICISSRHFMAVENSVIPQAKFWWSFFSFLICRYHAIHKEVYDWFNISFDEFGRTSAPPANWSLPRNL